MLRDKFGAFWVLLHQPGLAAGSGPQHRVAPLRKGTYDSTSAVPDPRLLPAAAALLGVSLSTQAGPAVRVPRATPVVIDGRMDGSEWRGSALQRLADGAELRLRHDGPSHFLGITSPRQTFASVCVARTDSIRVLHASAALGSVAYGHVADEWRPGDSAFVYGMRNPALTEAASGERADYISGHGWSRARFQWAEEECRKCRSRSTGTPASRPWRSHSSFPKATPALSSRGRGRWRRPTDAPSRSWCALRPAAAPFCSGGVGPAHPPALKSSSTSLRIGPVTASLSPLESGRSGPCSRVGVRPPARPVLAPRAGTRIRS